MRKFLCLLMLGIWTGGPQAWAVDERRVTRRAETLSREKKWDQAQEVYREALRQAPDSALLNYNNGVVSYRKLDFEDARASFLKALATEHKDLEAAASYNSGGALFKRSRQLQDTDPKAAIEALRQSLQYYRRALELSPKDKEARYNYELADKVLKILLKKKPPQSSGAGEKSQESRPQQNQQSGQKEQGAPQQPQPQDVDDKNKEEKKEEAAPRVPDARQGSEGAPGAGQPGDHLSEEEARLLIASYGNEGPRLDINKEKIPDEKEVEKNW